MTTTTLTLGEATLTVETSALFAAWAEKNLRPASPQPSHPAPRQGEHNREILREAGLSDAAIDELQQQKII